jgi:predicted helicase
VIGWCSSALQWHARPRQYGLPGSLKSNYCARVRTIHAGLAHAHLTPRSNAMDAATAYKLDSKTIYHSHRVFEVFEKILNRYEVEIAMDIDCKVLREHSSKGTLTHRAGNFSDAANWYRKHT